MNKTHCNLYLINVMSYEVTNIIRNEFALLSINFIRMKIEACFKSILKNIFFYYFTNFPSFYYFYLVVAF